MGASSSGGNLELSPASGPASNLASSRRAVWWHAFLASLLNFMAFSNVSRCPRRGARSYALRSQFIQLQRTQQLLVHIFVLHRRAIIIAPLHAVVDRPQIHRLRHNVVVVD